MQRGIRKSVAAIQRKQQTLHGSGGEGRDENVRKMSRKRSCAMVMAGICCPLDGEKEGCTLSTTTLT